jgi:hypothetical protein
MECIDAHHVFHNIFSFNLFCDALGHDRNYKIPVFVDFHLNPSLSFPYDELRQPVRGRFSVASLAAANFPKAKSRLSGRLCCVR